MKKRLDLHIGYPKTGTTTLQSCLSTNAARLAEHGVLYPKSGLINGAHYEINFALGIGDYDSTLTVRSPDVLRAALLEEAEQSDCKRLIVSSEYFSIAPDLAPIKDFFDGFDTRIVVYLRRHDRAMESAYSQAVKTSTQPAWDPTIDSFTLHQLTTLHRHYDYPAALKSWAGTFGHDAIIVRPYEPKQNKPDLIADFLAAIGLDAELAKSLVRPANVNATLSSVAISAIQLVRAAKGIDDDVKGFLISRLVQFSTISPGPGPRLSHAVASALLNRYGPGYAAIARSYLGRTDGVLFEDLQPTSQPDDRATVDSDAVLEYVLRAVADVLQ